jgi:hypothetical protein
LSGKEEGLVSKNFEISIGIWDVLDGVANSGGDAGMAWHTGVIYRMEKWLSLGFIFSDLVGYETSISRIFWI